jgi:ribonuclease-3
VAEDEVNFKSKLIEWCQKYRLHSEFVVVNDTLINANKHEFLTCLMINEKNVCQAVGSSKKDSQQNTARLAFHLIKTNPDFLQEILHKEEMDSSDFNPEIL